MESGDNITALFPTCVFTSPNLLSSVENKKIYDRVIELSSKVDNGGKNWSCNTLNSLGTLDLRNDPAFSEVIDAVTDKVRKFAKFFNSDYDYKMSESWYNLSLKGNFQEGHVHARNVFSCVYYVSAPVGSGNLLLYSNENEMMTLHNITNYTGYNCITFPIEPKEGLLVIFKSSVRHMVEVGHNEDPRISLSFNFH